MNRKDTFPRLLVYAGFLAVGLTLMGGAMFFRMQEGQRRYGLALGIGLIAFAEVMARTDLLRIYAALVVFYICLFICLPLADMIFSPIGALIALMLLIPLTLIVGISFVAAKWRLGIKSFHDVSLLFKGYNSGDTRAIRMIPRVVDIALLLLALALSSVFAYGFIRWFLSAPREQGV